MGRWKRSLAWVTPFLLLALLSLGSVQVEAHPKQTKTVGGYEVTYFSSPQDPIVNSPATLYIQASNATTGVQLRVFHFLVEMVPPSGPRIRQHPLSNSTAFSFNQPGKWILLFEIGLSGYTFTENDPTVDFFADVSIGATSGLLSGFLTALVLAIPRTYERWGHIFAVVLWLGTMLHIVNTYLSSSKDQTGLSSFARTYRRADLIVAVAIGLLALTGILRAFAHGLTTVLSLFESDFGLILFVKISLAAGMVAIGLFNRTYLLRNIEHAVPNIQPLAPGQVELSDNKIGVLAKRMYYLTILEMGLGVSAILFGTIFTQIHTIS